MDFYAEKHMKNFWIFHEILMDIDVAISWLFHGNEKPRSTKFNGGPGFQDPWKNHGFRIYMKTFMVHENIFMAFWRPMKIKIVMPSFIFMAVCK